MPGWVKAHGAFSEPDQSAIDAAVELCRAPFAKPAGSLTDIREKLYNLMWDDVGIVRDAASLVRSAGALDELEAELDATGVDSSNLAFNLTWHDWLNLKNLTLVSKSIRYASEAREDSRGAHFRADFPDVRDLENSRFTSVTWNNEGRGGRFECTTKPVAFTRVKPGESLLKS
jgi:fumarate reductase flavoprotein subunit